MIRIYVDFSVFTPSRSEGWVHGLLELPQVPREGDSVSFAAPKNGVSLLDVPGFVPNIIVEHVVNEAGAGPENVVLSLADVNLTNSADAEKLFDFFARGFGLYFDRTEDWTGED